ncbi:unnamed protein product [Symbiodinium sp. KB8]|nr:unnamed protein product [Symbiodinium sp. KB8]
MQPARAVVEMATPPTRMDTPMAYRTPDSPTRVTPTPVARFPMVLHLADVELAVPSLEASGH